MAKILVVDDAAFIQLKIATILKKHDHDVIEAENGQTGIDKYQSETPDLVLLDISMPDIDGITVLKRILEKDEKAKIIMITNLGEQKLLMESLHYGAKQYITKPFQEETLVDIIEQTLSK